MTGPGHDPAEDRREAVLREATHEFAILGLRRASTAAIAPRVGISQPYLFKLFGTKEALFVAALGRAFDRSRDGLRPLSRADARDALFSAREKFLLALQAVAASPGAASVRPAARPRLLEAYGEIGRARDMGTAEARTLFARALLWAVMAELDVPGAATGAARDLTGADGDGT